MEFRTRCRCLNRRRRTNAEKNNFNHPDSVVSGSGAGVQLGLFPAGDYPGDYQPAAARVAAKYNLGVEIMVVAGAVLAGVAFLLVCCLVVGSREDKDE